MKNKTYRRFSAFIIDIMVLGLFLMMIYYFVPENKKIKSINENIVTINEQFANNEIGKKDYLIKYSENIYQLDKDRSNYTAFNILIIIIYFVIVPIISKGKTLGLYILNLKIDGKLTIKSMFIRNLIATGLLYSLLSLILVYIFKDLTYFILITIFGLIQFILLVISSIMIIRNSKGLQDILSKTKIITNKEVKE